MDSVNVVSLLRYAKETFILSKTYRMTQYHRFIWSTKTNASFAL